MTIYFRESSSQSGIRFQEQEEPRWSSPSDRLHSRSSVIHDPGPSWSSPARQARLSDDHFWDSRGRSSLRFDSGNQRDYQGSPSFRFDNEGSSRSTMSQDTSKSTFRFESEDIKPNSFEAEGRSKSPSEDFPFGFQSTESNENLHKNSNSGSNYFFDNASSKRESDDDFPWKSKEESSGFSDSSTKTKHFGRQSKVSPIFDPSYPSSDSFEFPSMEDSMESGRHLSRDTIATISETLGAINTVGRYLVNYTRGGQPRPTPGDRLDTPVSCFGTHSNLTSEDAESWQHCKGTTVFVSNMAIPSFSQQDSNVKLLCLM
ncbi:Trypsin-like serine protease [Homalodisca vitripennis]|nr:Trypsin-like serine protease [Homalodisca vitripennis]